MLIENKLLLKKRFPHLLQNSSEMSAAVQVVEAKNGENTLLINDGTKWLSYLSRYNPSAEANQYIEGLADLSDVDHVFFVGVGLGYHLDALLEKYPHLKISIYEPNENILEAFLQHYNLNNLEKRIKYFFTDATLFNEESKLIHFISNNCVIEIFPSTLKFEENKVNNIIQAIKGKLNNQKQQMEVDSIYQFKWIENAIRNIEEVILSPNLFLHTNARECIEGKPVILVAAGPSLDLEIENLKKIKASKSAYIFAVGSAVNACLSNDIIPDALFSYDPTVKNAKVVQKIKNLQLTIPLVFGSTIASEVLEDYPGKKVHFLLNQDPISTNLIEFDRRDLIEDGPSIAVVSIEILSKLNPSTIFLVGQNLGFTKEKRYASGIDYIDSNIGEEHVSGGYVVIKDTGGNDMYSLPYLMSMKSGIEYKISQYSDISIINTTKNGAYINGTTYEPLEEVMEKYLTEENVVSEVIFEGENSYNRSEILKKYYEFEGEFDKLYSNFMKLLDIQKRISQNYSNKVINTLEADLTEFDKYFLKIEQSRFFSMVIGPSTRVQYKRLVDASSDVKNEKLPLKKAKLFLDVYTKYLLDIYATIIQIQDAFGKLKSSKIFKEGK